MDGFFVVIRVRKKLGETKDFLLIKRIFILIS